MHVAIQINRETIEVDASGPSIGIRVTGMSDFLYFSHAEARLVQAALDAAMDHLRGSLPGASRV